MSKHNCPVCGLEHEGLVKPQPISGELGSKTNPIPISKFQGGRSLIYYPVTARGKSTPLTGHKVYFVVDTAITEKVISKFIYSVQGFNNVNLFYTKVVQDKAGKDLAVEMSMQNNTGDTTDVVVNNRPYDFITTRFLYAIENRGGSFSPDVWVQFMT